MAIQFRDVKKKDKVKVKKDIDVEEEMMKKQGINYRKMILSTNFLDNYSYQIEIVSESLLQPSMAKRQTIMKDKLSVTANLFPEIFMANQADLFNEMMSTYDDKKATKYIRNYQMILQAQQEAAKGTNQTQSQNKKSEPKPKPKKENV